MLPASSSAASSLTASCPPRRRPRPPRLRPRRRSRPVRGMLVSSTTVTFDSVGAAALRASSRLTALLSMGGVDPELGGGDDASLLVMGLLRRRPRLRPLPLPPLPPLPRLPPPLPVFVPLAALASGAGGGASSRCCTGDGGGDVVVAPTPAPASTAGDFALRLDFFRLCFPRRAAFLPPPPPASASLSAAPCFSPAGGGADGGDCVTEPATAAGADGDSTCSTCCCLCLRRRRASAGAVHKSSAHRRTWSGDGRRIGSDNPHPQPKRTNPFPGEDERGGGDVHGPGCFRRRWV